MVELQDFQEQDRKVFVGLLQESLFGLIRILEPALSVAFVDLETFDAFFFFALGLTCWGGPSVGGSGIIRQVMPLA